MTLWQKFILNSLCLGNLLWSQSYTLVEEECTTPIINPAFKDRETLKLKLDNGLEAYLISDPQASEAGAVLTVGTGSWDDPEEFPGLAHFLEHLLFLGTEAFPIASDYNRFIREHNGQTNAYTTTDHTLYLFSVSPGVLEEALDRFSSFFVCPLFNPSGVERELNAVDQEFAKNFNQDPMRESYVMKELGNPNHPFHRFNAGNIQTLSTVSREILVDWYQKHYSANRMKVIIYGNQSIDTLKQWLIKDFSLIPVSSHTLVPPTEPIFGSDTEEKIVYIDSIKDTRMLRLTWEMPRDFASPMSNRPDHVIASIIGHEGQGSLLADLKQAHLVDNLSCGGYLLSKHHFLFTITITLTQEGLYQVNEIIRRCFQAIQLLKDSPIEPYIFEEIRQISLTNYQYQSKKDVFTYLMSLGGILVHQNLSSFPEKSFIPQQFNSDEFNEFVSYLTPKNVRLTVISKQPEGLYPLKEKWLNVSYKVDSIDPETIKNWSAPFTHKTIQLPPPNPFIAKNLKLNSITSDIKGRLPHPTLLVESDLAKVYYAQDHYFQVPFTQWTFEINTPAIQSSDAVKVILADLYVRCLDEALNHYTYAADLANLNYRVARTVNGISLTIFGYEENAEILFDLVLKYLKNCHPTLEKFHLYKEALTRRYANFKEEGLITQGFETYQNLLQESYSPIEERVSVLPLVSYEDFKDYLDHLFDQTYTEGLFYGNIHSSHAKKLLDKLQKTLNSQPYPIEHRLVERFLTLPNEKGPFIVERMTNQPSSAALLTIEIEPFSFKNRAAQQILAQALSSAFYASLRTEQQTGYLVFSNVEEIKKHLFFYFAVQSATHEASDLLNRYEFFLENFLKDMDKKELTFECFENIRQSLIHTLEHSPQTLAETGSLIYTLAFKYDGDFDWVNKRIQALKDLTYTEFLELCKEFLGKQNQKRLSVFVQNPNSKKSSHTQFSSPLTLKKLGVYKP